MARKMKDSGIEWIGEIPEGWEVLAHKYIMHKEKSICEHYSGEDVISLTLNGVVKRDLENPSGKMPTTFDGYQFVDPNDLLLCLFDIDVTPRCVGLVKDYGVTSPAYSRFKIHSGFCNAFYNYLLRFIDDEKVFVHLSKNLRSSLTESDFGAIKTIVPPKAEQQRIADYLDNRTFEIDTLSSKARSSIEEYKKLKQAVITQAVTKGVRGEREMKDSGVAWIGEIPKEWSVSPMKHFIDILPGYAFSSDDFCIEEGIPLLRGINVGVNEIRWDETVRWNHSISKQLESFFLKENDLVVGLDRPWISDGTRVAFIAKKDLPCLLLQRVCRIRTRCNFDIRWIYYWLSGSSFKDSLSTETTGISVPHISTKQIEQFIVAFPNLLEQTQVCNYLDAKCAEIDKLIAKKEQLIKELESYKKSLIYEVVTGKREIFTDITRKFPNI